LRINKKVFLLIAEVVMDAEVESVMASSQDQREEELQVTHSSSACNYLDFLSNWEYYYNRPQYLKADGKLSEIVGIQDIWGTR